MPVLLQVNKICKAYGANVLLEDATASFSSDQKIGMIGRNGAGKSTTLNTVSGLVRIRTGSIGLNGYRPDFNTPYGGYKDSGLGREFGAEAVRNFQEVKSIWR